jgi:nucleoside-diphosphate-sugar epimerase
VTSVDVLVLGCGYAGSAVARLARDRGAKVLATVRDAARAEALRSERFEVVASASLDDAALAAISPRVSATTQVVVAFPPDGTTDARIAPRFAHAGAIAYVSSTGVYGELRGVIDDTTPLPAHASERAARILDAEAAWRAQGATVLRCPGIYGADRGLHVRVRSGAHRIPDDGSNFTSRIHAEDLAQLLLASRNVRAETFVVGDLAPAMQREIVAWIAAEYGVPMPPSVPGESVHETLRADRRIDPSRALATLAVTLRYPHYRDGMM